MKVIQLWAVNTELICSSRRKYVLINELPGIYSRLYVIID